MNRYIATTKEWRDKVNGNSYFSTSIEDVEQDKNYILPFQYGYGTQSEYKTKEVLKSLGFNFSWDDIEFIKIDIEVNNNNISGVKVGGESVTVGMGKMFININEG